MEPSSPALFWWSRWRWCCSADNGVQVFTHVQCALSIWLASSPLILPWNGFHFYNLKTVLLAGESEGQGYPQPWELGASPGYIQPCLREKKKRWAIHLKNCWCSSRHMLRAEVHVSSCWPDLTEMTLKCAVGWGSCPNSESSPALLCSADPLPHSLRQHQHHVWNKAIHWGKSREGLVRWFSR